MEFPRIPLVRLIALAALACPAFAAGQAPRADATPRAAADAAPFRTRTATSSSAARLIPLDSLPPAVRERVRKTVTSPTLVTHAPVEEFQGSPALYRWLMEHPDRAAAAWQRLGVDCSPISDRGQGRFGWTDGQGSEITWSAIAAGPQTRIWFAEGHLKPGPLVPSIPVKAVVVLRHDLPATPEGKIRHEADVFCHADSRAANLVYRIFGASTDRMAEQAAEQLLMFFSGLSKYVAEHPQHADRLLAPAAARASSR